MVWGLLRVTIFTAAFLVGSIWLGPGLRSAASANSSAVPQLGQSAGTSLVVTCEMGKVVVKSLPVARGAVQLDCVRSSMVVVRDRPEAGKIPETMPFHNRLKAVSMQ